MARGDRKIIIRKLGLKNLDIYVTGKCNYMCGYCYGENDKYGSMEEEVYNTALELAEYIDVEYIQMCGGEPLVCPEFEKYVTLAKNKGFKIILRTNGILIEKHLVFISENCDWVGISVDGLPEYNSLMRTPRASMTKDEQFDKPVSAIFELKKLNPNIDIILASLVSKKNYKGIVPFADYLIKNKVPINKWKIYEFIEDKFRSKINHSEYEMSENDFSQMVSELPNDINGAPIQSQSAHTNRVSANCLIVYQNGDIKLMGKHYGNIMKNSFDTIIDLLIKDNALDIIEKNKENTYAI